MSLCVVCQFDGRRQEDLIDLKDGQIDQLRAELKEITQACTDPRVNLTTTLAECVRDAYSDIERLRAELAAAQALLGEARETIHGLIDQQAMPDYWWQKTVSRIDAILKERKK